MARTPVEKKVTIIAPDFYGTVDIDDDCKTIADALDKAGQDSSSIVKLEGSPVEINRRLAAGGVYLVAPEGVAKGGFDGGY